MTAYTLSRPQLDRLAIEAGSHGKLQLGCTMHPNAGTTPIYQDGCLRILCRECESVAAVVAVAGEGS